MVALVAGAGAVGWKLTRATRTSAVASAGINDKQARLVRELEAGEARLAVLDQEASALQMKLEQARQARQANQAVPAGRSTAGGSASMASRRSIPSVGSREALDRHLAAARAKNATVSWQIPMTPEERRRCTYIYQSLFQELGLSAAQIKTFVDLAMQRQEREMEFNTLFNDRVIAARDPLVDGYRQEFMAQQGAAFRELLGAAGYEKFQDYNRTTSAREVVTALAGTAVQAGMAFSPEQLERFVQVIADCYVPGGSRQVYPDGLYVSSQFDPIDWDRADWRLRPLMTDAEWALFKTQAPTSGRFAHQFQTAVWKAKEAEAASRKAAN